MMEIETGSEILAISSILTQLIIRQDFAVYKDHKNSNNIQVYYSTPTSAEVKKM
jgi:hypothetical protein